MINLWHLLIFTGEIYMREREKDFESKGRKRKNKKKNRKHKNQDICGKY